MSLAPSLGVIDEASPESSKYSHSECLLAGEARQKISNQVSLLSLSRSFSASLLLSLFTLPAECWTVFRPTSLEQILGEREHPGRAGGAAERGVGQGWAGSGGRGERVGGGGRGRERGAEGGRRGGGGDGGETEAAFRGSGDHALVFQPRCLGGLASSGQRTYPCNIKVCLCTQEIKTAHACVIRV